MLVTPKAAAPPREAAVPRQSSHRSTVLITERQVMFATAAGVAPRPVTALRPWLAALWQRLVQSVEYQPPGRHYPPLRPSYFEKAAMAREMDRL